MDQGLIEKLTSVEARYDQLSAEMSAPAVQGDSTKFRNHSKSLAEIQPLVEQFRAYKELAAQIAATEELLQDPDMRELAQDELASLQSRRDALLNDIKLLMVPKDPNDEKNVMLEIRAGTGGDEAALFAADLVRMYGKYAERQRWKIEVMDTHPTGIGGLKEAILLVQGRGAWSRLKFERGVHRVQRVPATESSGRIHTSTVTVAVLPEAEDVDITVDDKDVQVDVYRASGPGGQGVNTTDSAVRLTHLPTGLVVTCQDERSQIKNRAKAMRVLKARLLERAQTEQAAAIAADRRSQVGTGERSERIRTYNFPQGRVSDHRINLTLHRLPAVMEGDIDDLIDGLRDWEQSQKLQESVL